MRWTLWIWSPNLGQWRLVGDVNDGPNDNIRIAVMRGLLKANAGGLVYAFHPPDGREQKFWSPDGGNSLLQAA